MPEISTHLIFISDPGHGWLKVPLTEIATLGIKSPYSFIEGQYAFLEEEGDCPYYLEARATQGYPQPQITEQYLDRFAQPSLRFGHAALSPAFWEHWRR